MSKLQQILTFLEQSRLISLKGENFELSHDALAKAIVARRSVEEQAIVNWENLVRNKLHASNQSDTPDYLTIAQLQGLKAYQEKLNLQIEEQQFVRDSQAFQAAEAAKEKRKLLLLIFVLAGLATLIFVAWMWALYQGNLAQQELARNERIVSGMYFYQDQFALCVQKDSSGHYKYGFMDKQGKVRIPYDYDEAQHFDDFGFARVKIAGELYLIDTLNNRYLLAESIRAITPKTLALSLKEQLLDSIPLSVLENKQLKVLYLRGNALTNMPSELTKLAQLQVLDMGYNKLKDAPEGLLGLKNLKVLDLQHNQLSQFDSNLYGLSALQVLDLSDNNIQTIPSGISQLSQLIQLDLSNNNLVVVDESLEKLAALRQLNLYNNKLESLPDGLLQKSKLKLNVFGNKMNVQAMNKVYNNNLDNKDNSVVAAEENNTEETDFNSSTSSEKSSNSNRLEEDSNLNNNKEEDPTSLVENNQNINSSQYQPNDYQKNLDCKTAFDKNIKLGKLHSLSTKSCLLISKTDFDYRIVFNNSEDGIRAEIMTTGHNEGLVKPLEIDDKLMFISSKGVKKVYSFIFESKKRRLSEGRFAYVNTLQLNLEAMQWLANNSITKFRLVKVGEMKMYPFNLDTKRRAELNKAVNCFLGELDFSKVKDKQINSSLKEKSILPKTSSTSTSIKKKKTSSLNCQSTFDENNKRGNIHKLSTKSQILLTRTDFDYSIQFENSADGITAIITTSARSVGRIRPLEKEDKLMFISSKGEKKPFNFIFDSKKITIGSSRIAYVNSLRMNLEAIEWLANNNITSVRLVNMVEMKMYPYSLDKSRQEELRRAVSCFLQELDLTKVKEED